MLNAIVLFNCRRSRKKKVVAILPPPTRKNTTSSASPQVNSEEKKESKPKVQEQKAQEANATYAAVAENTSEANTPKKVNKVAGLGKLKRKTISINNMLSPTAKKGKKETEEFDESIINGPVTPYTKEALHTSWDVFSKKMKEQQKDSFYSTLASRKPEIIGENKLLLKLDNQVQMMEMGEYKADLLGFIRADLNNFAIQMQLKIEEQAQSTQLYTDTEKVKAMIDKNPLLSDLMKKYDLDVGF